MEGGYYVVDSVLAAQGRFKEVASGWSNNLSAALGLAEHEDDRTGNDHIIIDASGKVVG